MDFAFFIFECFSIIIGFMAVFLSLIFYLKIRRTLILFYIAIHLMLGAHLVIELFLEHAAIFGLAFTAQDAFAFQRALYVIKSSMILLFPMFFHYLFADRKSLQKNIVLASISAVACIVVLTPLFTSVAENPFSIGFLLFLAIFVPTSIYTLYLILQSMHYVSNKRIRRMFWLFFGLLGFRFVALFLFEAFNRFAVFTNLSAWEAMMNSAVYFCWNIFFLWFITDYIEVKAIPLPGVEKQNWDLLKQFRLSERETSIVTYLIQGYSNKEIGKLLFISELTVKTHVRNIYQKLHINSRVDLVNLVKSSG